MSVFRLAAILFIGISLTGCSGCSESGIRHQAAQNLQNESYDDRPKSEPTNQPDEVQSRGQQESLLNSSEGITLSNLYSASKSAVFTVYTSDDEMEYQGSGFFVSSDGIAVSNYHIFEDTFKGGEMILTESDDVYKIGRVIEQDKELDYIIFKVDGSSNFHALNLANSRPEIGEDVFAIGNPRGLSHSLSTGIISSYRDGGRLLQTTAEITHGSSGGALLNMNGEVVGITTGGFGEANLNFALNIRELRLERYL